MANKPWTISGQEHWIAYSKEYRQRPHVKAKRNAYQAEYRERNREEIRERDREYSRLRRQRLRENPDA